MIHRPSNCMRSPLEIFSTHVDALGMHWIGERSGLDVIACFATNCFYLVTFVFATNCFSHGQLYVAISRIRSNKGLKMVIRGDEDKNLTNTSTNVAYKEVLNNFFITLIQIKD